VSIQAVIFDLAGVVLLPIHGTFAGLMAERLGVSEAEILHVLGKPENDMWDMDELSDDEFFNFLLAELDLPITLKAILEKFVVDDFYVDPEMLAYIRMLQKTYKTALLTNFPSHVHDFMQTAWRVDGAFDHIIASCDVKLVKPDPAIYQFALDRLGCQPSEAVFVDDRPINVTAAQEIGMVGFVYENAGQTIKDLEKVLSAGI
jgi:epoxide hydrolase-like predicted phosphatase